MKRLLAAPGAALLLAAATARGEIFQACVYIPTSLGHIKAIYR